MTIRPDDDAAISRRECLAATGEALLAAAQPALANVRGSGPPGHRRTTPAFRPISLDK